MKKLISIGLGFLLAFSAIAQSGNSVTHFGGSFLNGLGNVLIPDASTNLYTSTNIQYISYQGQAVGSYTNVSVIYTNAAGLTTNTFIVPGHFTDVVGTFADANGNVNTNLCITVAFNNTNLFLPPVYSGLPNPNNNNNVTNWFYTNVINAATTNTVIFTFEKCADDIPIYNPPQSFGSYVQPVVTGTSVGGTLNMFDNNNTFAFTVALNAHTGGTYQVYSTNLPASFVTGAKAIRLVSVSTVAATNAGLILNKCILGGWHP